MSDWREAVDPASGRTYYANIRTKQTSWTLPDELRRYREQKSQSDEPPPPPPPPSSSPAPGVVKKKKKKKKAWRKVVDRRSGKVYYFNRKTQETSWEMPPGYVDEEAEEEAAAKRDAQRAKAEEARKAEEAAKQKQAAEREAARRLAEQRRKDAAEREAAERAAARERKRREEEERRRRREQLSRPTPAQPALSDDDDPPPPPPPPPEDDAGPPLVPLKNVTTTVSMPVMLQREIDGLRAQLDVERTKSGEMAQLVRMLRERIRRLEAASQDTAGSGVSAEDLAALRQAKAEAELECQKKEVTVVSLNNALSKEQQKVIKAEKEMGELQRKLTAAESESTQTTLKLRRAEDDARTNRDEVKRLTKELSTVRDSLIKAQSSASDASNSQLEAESKRANAAEDRAAAAEARVATLERQLAQANSSASDKAKAADEAEKRVAELEKELKQMKTAAKMAADKPQLRASKSQQNINKSSSSSPSSEASASTAPHKRGGSVSSRIAAAQGNIANLFGGGTPAASKPAPVKPRTRTVGSEGFAAARAALASQLGGGGGGSSSSNSSPAKQEAPKGSGKEGFSNARAALAARLGGGSSAPSTAAPAAAPPASGAPAAAPPAAAPPAAAPPAAAPPAAAPAAAPPAAAPAAAPPAAAPPAATRHTRVQTMPTGQTLWKSAVDSSSGKTYYYNTVTNETSWDKPKGFGVTEATPQAADNGPGGGVGIVPEYSDDDDSSDSDIGGDDLRGRPSFSGLYINAKPDADSKLPPPQSPHANANRPEHWKEIVDPNSGHKYYYNVVTMETSWEKPDFGAPVGTRPGGRLSVVPDFGSSPPHKPMAAPAAITEEDDEPSALGGETRLTRSFTVGKMDGDKGFSGKVRAHNDTAECLEPLTEEEAGRCTMLAFAEANFNAHKKGLFAKQTMAEMISFNQNTISHPLQQLSKATHDTGVQTWRNITSFMGVRKSGKPPMGHIEKLSRIGLSSPEEVRDEIFCQLVKQTTGNPDKEWNIRGWQLMAVLLGVFPPSRRFEMYLKNYFQRSREFTADPRVPKYAKYCEERLHRAMRAGPRESVPSMVEVRAAQKLKEIKLTVGLLDGSTYPVAVQPMTSVYELVAALCRTLQLPYQEDENEQIWCLYEVNPVSGTHVRLHPKARVLDVRAHYFECMENAGMDPRTSEVRLIFRCRLFFERDRKNLSTDALNSLFVQAHYNVVHTHYACTNKDAFKLLALYLRAVKGSEEFDMEKTLRDSKLKHLLPRAVLNQYKMDTKFIRTTVKQELAETPDSPIEAKRMYLQIAGELPTYGCEFFPVRLNMKRGAVDDVILGISERGVFVLHPITRQPTRKTIDIHAVEQVKTTDEQLLVTAEGKTLDFQSSEPHVIASLIKVYQKDRA